MSYPKDYVGQTTTSTHAYPMTGYAQVDSAPPPSPRFSQIAEGISNLPNGLYKAVSRIRSIADRYGGSVPEPVTSEKSQAESTCVAARLESSAAAIESLLQQLHNQIDRLDRF